MHENRQILKLNSAGHPTGWVNYQTAVRLYYLDQIAFECGSSNIVIKGGTSRLTGLRSVININSIYRNPRVFINWIIRLLHRH
ncbi:MAG: hypothetical protein Ct9H90mP18_10910 [Gammaproteobacteria bacterium]|nr:MAG: hypothetical protein Ct9H90mP18_10910 [Gammaproteobacteria bacterium]